MIGHGHVTPRPDGAKARCGGPSICTDCAHEAGRLHSRMEPAPVPAPLDEPPAVWPAGRELDAEIARLVFGHQLAMHPGRTEPVLANGSKTIRPYSTDLAAAWLVVEEMRRICLVPHQGYVTLTLSHGAADGYQYECVIRPRVYDSQGGRAQEGDARPVYIGEANRPALAICRAALKLVAAS
jgi:hypothetical protein